MANVVAILCVRLDDGIGYRTPGSMTIRCTDCRAVCMISLASFAQWSADRPELPHEVVCTRCFTHVVHAVGEIELAMPNAEVIAEISDGIKMLETMKEES